MPQQKLEWWHYVLWVLGFMLMGGAGDIGVLFYLLGTVGWLWLRRQERNEESNLARAAADEQRMWDARQQEEAERLLLEQQQAQRDETQRRAERFEVYLLQKSEFKRSNEYKLLAGFVRGRGATRADPADLARLRDLLEARGHSFTVEEMEKLVEGEREEQFYERFRGQLLIDNQMGLTHIIRRYLEIVGDNENRLQETKPHLRRALMAYYSDAEIDAAIDHVRRSVELEHFERTLLLDQQIELPPQDGLEFQAYLARLFERMGYAVEEMKLSGDQGADLIVTKFGVRTVVQAKRYSGTVGNGAVQEALAAKAYYKTDQAMVVTTGSYSPSALDLASSTGVDLIDANHLQEWLRKHG